MSLYQWQSGSLIQQLEVTGPKKLPQALLYAPPGANADQLRQIPDYLRKMGFTAEPDTVDGKFVLRVQKIGNEKNLIDALSRAGYVQGQPTVSEVPNRHGSDNMSFTDRVKENSLRLTGLFYLLGDALFIGAGIARKDFSEGLAGALWASAGLPLFLFGKKDADAQMARLYSELGDFLNKEGVDVPEPEKLSMKALGRKGGFIEKFQEFIYDHPVEFASPLYIAAGASVAKAGFNQNNPYKATAGGLLVAGNSIGMLGKDKDKKAHPNKQEFDTQELGAGGVMPVMHDEQGAAASGGKEKKKSLISDPVGWFIEKPMRLGGALLLMSNLSVLFGANYERKRNKHIRGQFEQAEAYAKGAAASDGKLKLGGLTQPKREVGITETAQKMSELAGDPAKRTEFEAAMADSKAIEGWRAEVSKQTKMSIGGKEMMIKNYQLNVAATLLYICANAMYSISSKDTSKDLQQLGRLGEITSLGANIIASQPEQVRNQMIDRMATYMSQQKDVPLTAEQMAQELHKKVDLLGNNPWRGKGEVGIPGFYNRDSSPFLN